MVEIIVALIVTAGSVSGAYFAFRAATHSKSASHSVNDRTSDDRKPDQTLRDLVIDNHDGIVHLNGRVKGVEEKVNGLYDSCPMTQDEDCEIKREIKKQ